MLVTTGIIICRRPVEDNFIPATLQIPHPQWLPEDAATISKWLSKLIRHVDINPVYLHPVIQEFQSLIENDATIFMLFNQMFYQIPQKPPYRDDPSGKPQVRNYRHMLQLFNHILNTAPEYNDSSMVGFPINAILDWPMGTPAGITAFLNKDVNAQFKKMLNVWSNFLTSPESRYVLNTTPNGWLGPAALSAMETANQGSLFIESFECQPSKPYWGFKSWDDFFTRKFRPGIRPIASPDDNNVITNACESSPYRISCNIQAHDKFWIKAQPYSLFHMLDNDPLAPQFVGGTIYQGYLNALSYHRWHSPVTGTVVKTCLIPGTYYSECPSAGFSFTELSGSSTIKDDEKPDPEAPNDSQAYITAVATRALIFIQADNVDIGLMCFIAVGMAEVSTCAVGVRAGQRVRKGEELGIFRFGGSTHCLLFRGGVELEWDLHGLESGEGADGNGGNIKVNDRLAVVVNKMRGESQNRPMIL